MHNFKTRTAILDSEPPRKSHDQVASIEPSTVLKRITQSYTVVAAESQREGPGVTQHLRRYPRTRGASAYNFKTGIAIDSDSQSHKVTSRRRLHNIRLSKQDHMSHEQHTWATGSVRLARRLLSHDDLEVTQDTQAQQRLVPRSCQSVA